MTSENVLLAEALSHAAALHPVPGALVGLLSYGQVAVAAYGTANLNTCEPMTPQTGFLTGSITKVWASCLAMTFVEEGLLDLDAPVVQHAPWIRFGREPEYAQQISVRMLLNHSSGVDSGDLLI